MDDRRARNHARDRRIVMAAMPSVVSWRPAATTGEIIAAVDLPERTVLHLLHELNVEGFASVYGTYWRRRRDLPPSSPSLNYRSVPMDVEPAASLVAAMRAEMRVLYGDLDLDATDMPKAGPRELGPPLGTFLVGIDNTGDPICCGGIKGLPDGACEIKRMYVKPQGRGRGVARQLLMALEDAARGLGYAIARLDTGPRQRQAERIYRERGYRPVGNFNGNPVASFFGEKSL